MFILIVYYTVHVQGGTGAGDALSVYVVVSLLEARNYHVQAVSYTHLTLPTTAEV